MSRDTSVFNAMCWRLSFVTLKNSIDIQLCLNGQLRQILKALLWRNERNQMHKITCFDLSALLLLKTDNGKTPFPNKILGGVTLWLVKM